jgi:hypothetical protein
MLYQEVRKVFVINAGGFHHEDHRNIVRNDELLDPLQEAFESCGRVLEGFWWRDGLLLFDGDGTEAGIEGLIRNIDADGLFEDRHKSAPWKNE